MAKSVRHPRGKRFQIKKKIPGMTISRGGRKAEKLMLRHLLIPAELQLQDRGVECKRGPWRQGKSPQSRSRRLQQKWLARTD